MPQKLKLGLPFRQPLELGRIKGKVMKITETRESLPLFPGFLKFGRKVVEKMGCTIPSGSGVLCLEFQ